MIGLLLKYKWIIRLGLCFALMSFVALAYMEGYKNGKRDVEATQAEIRAASLNRERERRDAVKAEMRKVVGNVEGNLDDDFYTALDCLHDIRDDKGCVSAFAAVAGED